MGQTQDTDPGQARGWSTDEKFIREFDRPVGIEQALVSTVTEATQEWSELSATPPLEEFVDAERLEGLIKTKSLDTTDSLPLIQFPFQSCQVTVLYGLTVRILIER
ncbi:MAG: hypothetical protein ABEI27_11880 [Halobellus sp.]|uniref:hypothetical protein n=1 Tax=Halobellus sp. TaxID=1979212 RepID=UPI0035D43E65